MAKFQVFSAAGPVSCEFSVREDAQAEADNAEKCFGVELAVIQICPVCKEPVRSLTGNGYKINAWECNNCGRAGC